MNRGLALFGAVALLVGLGTGWLICAHPEGLNPSWPLGMAMIVPVLFTLTGLQMVASAAGYPRVSGYLLAAIAAGFFVILNWAAFFTTGFHCSETLSFFGVGILERHPSEVDCRTRLRMIAGCVDALVALFFIAFAWHRFGTSRTGKGGP